MNINQRYDAMKEPWRFLTMLALTTPGIVLMATGYTIGALWLMILIFVRIMCKEKQ